MTSTLRITLGLALLTIAAPAAHAQRKGGPTLVVAASNATASAESAKGVARTAVRPNDVIRYTLTFNNVTDHAVGNVELRNPIPAGVAIVPGSAKASRADARLEFSADNGKSWSARPTETALDAAGKPITRDVPVARYTNIRWTIGGTVPARTVITAEFEARVNGAGA